MSDKGTRVLERAAITGDSLDAEKHRRQLCRSGNHRWIFINKTVELPDFVLFCKICYQTSILSKPKLPEHLVYSGDSKGRVYHKLINDLGLITACGRYPGLYYSIKFDGCDCGEMTCRKCIAEMNIAETIIIDSYTKKVNCRNCLRVNNSVHDILEKDFMMLLGGCRDVPQILNLIQEK